MTKADLVDKISELGITKRQALRAVETALSAMKSSLLKGEKVSIVGFGTFRAVQRRGRMGRNPKTGTAITISPKTAVTFKPGQHLRRVLNPDRDPGPPDKAEA
jgi:DNA-binding protein HU-beta